jgi:hypothetical protein
MKGYSPKKFEKLAKKAIKIAFKIRYRKAIGYGYDSSLGKDFEKQKELVTFIKKIVREKDK